MDIAKKIVKRLIGIENPKQILPLQSLTYIGAGAWGYWVPSNFLNKHSVCYCVGAGEDISFDTQLKTKYDCAIYIFDPTPASKKHFDEVVKASLSNEPLPFPPLNPEYRYAISYNKLKEMHFIEEGVWSHKDVLKFYDADQDNYVSHSVVLFKDSGKTMELPVNSIKNFMTQFGHRSIDLLKLEIEGAEYTVIDSLIRDKADVKIIAVEFDEIYHKKGVAHLVRIRNYTRKLQKAGYVLVHSNEHYKRTFIRKDVYTGLRAKEKLITSN